MSPKFFELDQNKKVFLRITAKKHRVLQKRAFTELKAGKLEKCSSPLRKFASGKANAFNLLTSHAINFGSEALLYVYISKELIM